VSSANLGRAVEQSPALHRHLLRYGHAFVVQTAQTALANGRSKLEERLARWLLMANDRLDGNEVPLTHEFLSVMLGVRRPGVTTALDLLEKEGLVQAKRRAIAILDRTGLRKVFNGAYGAPEAEFKRLFG
jgi:CRP-like cAMP-binding protein